MESISSHWESSQPFWFISDKGLAFYKTQIGSVTTKETPLKVNRAVFGTQHKNKAHKPVGGGTDKQEVIPIAENMLERHLLNLILKSCDCSVLL